MNRLGIKGTGLAVVIGAMPAMATGGCKDAGGGRLGDETDGSSGGAADIGDAPDGTSTGDEACVPDREFFELEVYEPILKEKCLACHNPLGAAAETSFVMRSSDTSADYIDQNFGVFASVAKLQYDGVPWVLLKPTEGIEHVGGTKIDADGDEYAVLEEMVHRVENPSDCVDDGSSVAEFFDGVELLDEVGTLRKVTMSLAGRLPTAEEEARVAQDGLDGLDAVLDEIMKEEAFYERILELYNDFFLTDRYLPNTDAIDLLDSCDAAAGQSCDYPTARWYNSLPDDERSAAAEASNRALAREPLQLVAHVVRNDLPYSEILTADYTVVNPFSAKTLGADAGFSSTDDDETDWRAAKVPGVPHAGVLTTTVWLTRFPTTPTNRNRHRSNVLADFFLATDFESLGTRPVDTTAILGVNPTFNDEQCAVCHATVDPVAGAFQNWTDQGSYRPPEGGWYPEMAKTGFGPTTMPNDQTPAALAWIAQQVVDDRRFGRSAVRIAYRGLTGADPLSAPTDPDRPGYLAGLAAKRIQDRVFDDVVDTLSDHDYNLKEVFKALAKSHYYRAMNVDEDVGEQRLAELSDLGTARLLTPEALNRRIVASTGYPWRDGGVGGQDHLLDTTTYGLFYGGIDSDGVVERVTEPNGLMINLSTRMANEVACLAVPQDLAKAPGERKLFPMVEAGTEPVGADESSVRDNIAYLAARLWGTYPTDDEIEPLFALYRSVWEDGRDGVESGLPGYALMLPQRCRALAEYWSGDPLPDDSVIDQDPTYTVRSWMAVLVYMMSDYRFLVE